MKVLVTGATGFVGRFLVDELRSSGHQVIAAVHALQGNEREFLKSRNLTAFECNLTDRAEVIKKVTESRVDALVHLAGISHVVRAGQDVSQLIDVNAVSVRHLCDAINTLEGQQPIPFVFASTALVYGQPEFAQQLVRVGERTPLNPISAYAKSKAVGELILSTYGGTRVKPYIVRPFNHTGPGQSPDFVCPGFAKKVAETTDGIIKVGNLGAQRDLSDVRDIVRAYRLIVEKSPAEDTFVLGSGHLVRISEVLAKLIKISGKNIEAIVDPSLLRAADDTAIYADYSLAQKVLGWSPKYDLEQTLSDLYHAQGQA